MLRRPFAVIGAALGYYLCTLSSFPLPTSSPSHLPPNQEAIRHIADQRNEVTGNVHTVHMLRYEVTANVHTVQCTYVKKLGYNNHIVNNEVTATNQFYKNEIIMIIYTVVRAGNSLIRSLLIRSSLIRSSLIRSSLIRSFCSDRSRQMSDRERFAQVAQRK